MHQLQISIKFFCDLNRCHYPLSFLDQLSLSLSSQGIFPKIALLSENIHYYGGSHFYLSKNDVHQHKNSRITKIL